MRTVLLKFIDRDQTGFLQNRYIGENIRMINILEYNDSEDVSVLNFFIDFEKKCLIN